MIDGGLEKQSIYFKTTFEYHLYFNFIHSTFARFQTNIYDITYLNGNVPKSRYFKIGGSSALRGFDENSFLHPRFHVFTFELINQQKTVMLKTFVDIGSNKFMAFKEYLYSCRFGFKQVNDKTIISLIIL